MFLKYAGKIYIVTNEKNFTKFTMTLWSNLINWAGDGTGRIHACSRSVGKLWRVSNYVGLPCWLFSPNPPDKWNSRSWFWLRQQGRSDKIFELLREICVTQKYMGPKRASMFRVDHHWTPALSQHQLGRGQLRIRVRILFTDKLLCRWCYIFKLSFVLSHFYTERPNWLENRLDW